MEQLFVQTVEKQNLFFSLKILRREWQNEIIFVKIASRARDSTKTHIGKLNQNLNRFYLVSFAKKQKPEKINQNQRIFINSIFCEINDPVD